MNTILKTAAWLSWLLLLAPVAGANAADAQSSTSAEPGVVERTEAAVVRGAKAAERGVERGAQAAASGVERGAKATGRVVKRGADATARGVERGAQATRRTAGRVSNKLGGSAATPSTAASNPQTSP